MLFALNREIYLPDTSALIAAWEERYPQELFREVWQFIDSLGDRLKICEEVRIEVERHAPDLLEWLGESSVDWQLSLTLLGSNGADLVQYHLQRIVNGWPRWRSVRSRNDADPWVIAYALALAGVVVSEERPGGRDVKIPEVCSTVGVRHMNLLDLFRAEGFGRV